MAGPTATTYAYPNGHNVPAGQGMSATLVDGTGCNVYAPIWFTGNHQQMTSYTIYGNVSGPNQTHFIEVGANNDEACEASRTIAPAICSNIVTMFNQTPCQAGSGSQGGANGVRGPRRGTCVRHHPDGVACIRIDGPAAGGGLSQGAACSPAWLPPGPRPGPPPGR